MLPEETLSMLDIDRCPDCETMGLAAGPRGGLGQNVACPACGAEFNVVRQSITHGVVSGPVVMAFRNSARGGPDRERLRAVFGIGLPPADDATEARERAARAYFDVRSAERACDRCGEFYRGPAMYCSLRCALDDA